MKWTVTPLLIALMLVGCKPSPGEIREQIKSDPVSFDQFWRQGKAEVSRYRLKQARYGEIHEGDAVLIFVTEDFLKDAQVKRDFGDDPAQSVLKLNFTKKFDTGLYPYSLMTSVFTTVDFKETSTPKATFSGQEWCGHVFTQLNLRDDSFQAQGFSYFQNEGDFTSSLEKVLLEDELWNKIRVAPDTLPLGKLKVLPSLEHSRLRHQPLEAKNATLNLAVEIDSTFSKKEVYVYSVAYETGRRLEIYFEREAPFQILGWREKVGQLTTTGVRTHWKHLDYWNKNHKADSGLRKELGLD